MNVGEELVSAYLECVKECGFVQKNLYTPDVQGEIDVVGINLSTRTVYVCEVAIHLVTGLQYKDNVRKLVQKFEKDIQYAENYLPEFNKVFMLWSPVVKPSLRSKAPSQLDDVIEVQRQIREKFGVELETIINQRFCDCIAEMREYARNESKEIKNPILRTWQIEEYLEKHLKSPGLSSVPEPTSEEHTAKNLVAVPSGEDFEAILKFRDVFSSMSAQDVVRWEGGERTTLESVTLPCAIYSSEVEEFQTALYDHKFIQSFDWGAWQEEAVRYLNDPHLLAEADLNACIKLLTTHVRKERFCEGHLASVIQSGHVFAILERLQQLRPSDILSAARLHGNQLA